MSSQPSQGQSRQLFFGPFAFDEAEGELKKHGIRLRLKGQPLWILGTLIRQPGHIVTRDEFQRKLWNGSTFVDFDHGLNAAMGRLRQVLGDSADQPRYIETLPGRGYRFIAPIQESVAKGLSVIGHPSAGPDAQHEEPSPPVTERTEVQKKSEPLWRRTFFPWALAVAVLTIVAGIGWWTAWRATQPINHRLVRLNVDLGPDALAGEHMPVAISPDGTRLVFPVLGPDGKRQLAMQPLDQSQSILLPDTEGGADPFFSPDGQWIGFFALGKMKKISIRGGTAVTLCDAPEARGAAWGEDDNIIATLNSGPATGLSRIPATGGSPREITHPDLTSEATHRWPQILPGGHSVLFMGNPTASNYDNASIEVLSLKTGRIKVLQRGGYFGRYVPGGYLVYIHKGALFGVRLDLDRMEVQGAPVLLQEDVAGNPTNAGGQYVFSNNGALVYLSGKSSSGTWTLMWLDRSGNIEPLLGKPGIYFNPRVSPDEKRVAYSTNSAIEIYDWGRDTTTQLTFTADTQTNLRPVWTPDAKHIIYVSQGRSAFSLEWTRADGSGQAHRLLESRNELSPYSLSPDGKRLAFEERRPETGLDIWTLPLDLNDPEHPLAGKPELLVGTPFNEEEPAFSPDGRWIAYVSNEAGQSEVYVQTFPIVSGTRSGKWLISAAGGRFPMWSRDGRQLFYRGPDHRIMVVNYWAHGDSFVVGKPSPWSMVQISDEQDLAPAGNRFLIAAQPRRNLNGNANPSVHVTFLLNFFDELRRRVSRSDNQ
jgi:Tol biopolymer transport system component/DNA-binding winged helix-turn-helix (wHTH) protein